MSIMEKLNPLYKMITVIVAAVILSFNHSVMLNVIVFFISILLILLFSKAKKSSFLKLLIPLSIITVSLYFTGAKNAQGSLVASYAIGDYTLASLGELSPSYMGLQLSTRVMGYVGLGILFSLTTPSEDLVLSLMHQTKVKPKFAYGVLAAFHLMPNIKRELEDAKLAYKVRGIKVSKLSLKPFFAAMVNCIRWSETLAMAMESKGFDGDGKRTFDRQLKVRACDIAVLIITPSLILLGMFTLHY